MSVTDRQLALDLIAEAVSNGARQSKACDVLDISERTIRRWKRQLDQSDCLADLRKQSAENRAPTNKLTEEEKQHIIAVCNQPKWRSLPPSQIVPQLADQGVYIASESSFYRVLHEVNQVNRRGKAHLPKTVPKPKGFKATGPNQVWSWDITFLASMILGCFYRLYLIEDIFSRKIVGWEIHESERADHASELVRKTCLAEGIHQAGLVLHSDNGSPMKGATMLATLQRLGIVPSFSRPSVSDDNPYSESLFRTLKYAPSYPTKPFESIEAARQWVSHFVHWYNETHLHSGIGFVTPGQKHRGEDPAIMQNRRAVYQAAKTTNPARWSGDIRNWQPVKSVWLNPPKELTLQDESIEIAA